MSTAELCFAPSMLSSPTVCPPPRESELTFQVGCRKLELDAASQLALASSLYPFVQRRVLPWHLDLLVRKLVSTEGRSWSRQRVLNDPPELPPTCTHTFSDNACSARGRHTQVDVASLEAIPWVLLV